MWKAQVTETAWILQRLTHPGQKVNQGFRRVPVLFANESKWSMYVSWMLMSGSLRQGEWWGHRLLLSSGVDTILSPTTWISQQTGFGTDHSKKPQLNHRRGCTHRERIGIQNNDHIGQVMEKAMAPHSSTLVWKIPWTEEPGRLQTMGSRRVGHDWATSLHFSLSCIGEGNGNPLQCSCLENPRDGGAWWAAVYGVVQSRTRLKRLSSIRCLKKKGTI